MLEVQIGAEKLQFRKYPLIPDFTILCLDHQYNEKAISIFIYDSKF